MYTHIVGFEDFHGHYYAEVEISFDAQPAEPPCTYSNGNKYPGCAAQVDINEARILNLTGICLEYTREQLNSNFLEILDNEVLARVCEEADSKGLKDDLIESL